VSKAGYSVLQPAEGQTLFSKANALRERYRIHVSATLAVLVLVTFFVAREITTVQKFLVDSGLIQYLTLIVLLDLAISVYRLQSPGVCRLMRNQDEAMPRLLDAVASCRGEGADLLEYAGMTTLPLIRAIRRECVPLRMLVKHPETIEGMQKQIMITTLDALYNAVFAGYDGACEIRCYRLPFTLRGRRLGKEVLELGWLTPDAKRQTAYGHGNPSIIAELSTTRNDHLRVFFEKTFNELWTNSGTEDGRAVLARLRAAV
jgi:hypothetical protein